MTQQIFPPIGYSEQDPQWQDALWFMQRPGRTIRLRGIHPAESLTVRHGRMHILVQKTLSGERWRTGVTLLAISPELMEKLQSDCPNAVDADSVLMEL